MRDVTPLRPGQSRHPVADRLLALAGGLEPHAETGGTITAAEVRQLSAALADVGRAAAQLHRDLGDTAPDGDAPLFIEIKGLATKLAFGLPDGGRLIAAQVRRLVSRLEGFAARALVKERTLAARRDAAAGALDLRRHGKASLHD